MTVLLITCANCSHEYEPSREDILKGITHWRLCPDCRQLDLSIEIEPNRKEPSSRLASGENNTQLHPNQPKEFSNGNL